MDQAGTTSSTESSGVPFVIDNPDKSRYELHVGDDVAGIVAYRIRGQAVDLLHTEVSPGFQGGGLASKLAQASLDDARARHMAVLPTCPYIRSWIRKHPDYADLVPADLRDDLIS
jgi:predicted GNAT family acetyltransferase